MVYQMSVQSLVFAFVLVLVLVGISRNQKLGLEGEILSASIRLVIQLVLVGFVLSRIFTIESGWLTLILVAFMTVNAAFQASKRNNGIPNAFRISIIAMGATAALVLGIMVVTGSLKFVPSQIIPIMGMIGGNAMSTIGLSFRNLSTTFRDQSQQINERLALGASPRQAAMPLMQEAIKGAIQPTVDSAKTVGLVALPGMMSGMILAGTDPVVAIMYQILVYFMLMAVVGLASVITVYLAYQTFFTPRAQLITER